MTPIELIRQRVKISVLRQRLMKRRVENRNLRQRSAEHSTRRENALDVCGIVQRREFDAVFDAAQHFVGYQDRARETFATVDHAMSDGVNEGHAVYASDT